MIYCMNLSIIYTTVITYNCGQIALPPEFRLHGSPSYMFILQCGFVLLYAYTNHVIAYIAYIYMVPCLPRVLMYVPQSVFLYVFVTVWFLHLIRDDMPHWLRLLPCPSKLLPCCLYLASWLSSGTTDAVQQYVRICLWWLMWRVFELCCSTAGCILHVSYVCSINVNHQ